MPVRCNERKYYFLRCRLIRLVALPLHISQFSPSSPSRQPNLVFLFTIVPHHRMRPPRRLSTSSSPTMSSFPSRCFNLAHCCPRFTSSPSSISRMDTPTSSILIFLGPPISSSRPHHPDPTSSSSTLTSLSQSCYYPNCPHTSLIQTPR
jgi:hypothetical protein